MSNGIQVPSEFFWRTKFFPTSWTAVFSQVWRRSIFKFCVYKLAEAVRYLKFKWEFVIIGRGCLVLLKFKSSLCLRMLCFKALQRLCFCGINLPFVNRGGLRIRKGGDSLRKFWIKPLKETDLGVARAFFWPLKETMSKHRQYTYFYIFSCATLNETFMAKYEGVLPRTP